MITKIFSSKEKVFDTVVDLFLDILLILIDVLSAPIVLPAKLAATGFKSLAKMFVTRETRKHVKVVLGSVGVTDKEDEIMTKRLPLPKRFNVGMTDAAYAKLRDLNDEFGYGNNYLLTFILENFDGIIDRQKFDQVMGEIKKEYGAPVPASMKKS